MSEALIHNLRFDESGLIPAVVQDHETDEVLMLAYMNAESLGKTLQTGETWFWSRARQSLWHKGETSGHTQRVIDIRLDCDGDALLVRVHPRGPACHTGARTCFFRGAAAAEGGAAEDVRAEADPAMPASPSAPAKAQVAVVDLPAMELGIQLQNLFTLIQERQDQRPENSYTSYLFNCGLDKILKKIGEEAAETIIAAKNEGTKELSAEITDLLYHLLVLMVERGVSLRDVLTELGSRAGRQADPKYSK